MILESLTLRYFKGIKEFTLTTNGGNCSVFADNAVGKSSLADAFSYLLFGKDSSGKTDFEIKTLDANGEPLHHLNHECECVLRHNGRLTTLRKVYKEKWTQKRKSINQEFDGHVVEYFLDGVPVTKRDYDAFIASMISEDIFKLLTSPTYFNNNLHWEKRRQIILDVCGGDISDEDVISSNKDLAKLPQILNGRTIDAHRKVINARQAKINERKKEIPVRIDEKMREMPDITGIDENLLITEISALKSHAQEKRNELSRIQSGGQVAENTKTLRQVEAKILEIQNKQQAETMGKTQAKRTELDNIRGQMSFLKLDVQQKQALITRNESEISRLKADAQRLRGQYGDIQKIKFAHDDQLTCPTCKQSLPEEHVENARQQALADFNLMKSSKLENINTAGKDVMTEVKKLEQANEELAQQVAVHMEQLAVLNNAGTILQNEIETAGPVEPSPEYTAACEEKVALQKEISALSADNQDAVARIGADIATTEIELTAKEKQIHQIDTHVAGQKRIEELKKEEKTLAAEYERLEGELFLTEEFIRSKVNLLDDKISSKFRIARFKMFNVQVNGAIDDRVCETLYSGVPYSGGLNAGHKIIVGMDIIRTLSEHYGFTAPIFVDNAESVSVLPEMDAQVIRLVKPEIRTEEDKEMYSKLVVQTEDENKLREAV